MPIKLSLAASKEQVTAECGKVTFPKAFNHAYQIPPGEKVYCILDVNPTRIYTIEWGLIPHFSKRLSNRGNLTEIDTNEIASKPSSRIPFRSKRGIILADAIYYIHKKGLDYTPYRIQRKDKHLMKLACLWDEYRKDDQYLATTALITRKISNFICSSFPIEFTSDEQKQWMEERNLDAAEVMLNKKFHPEAYDYFKVTNRLLDDAYNEKDLTAAIPTEINLFSFL